MAPLRASWTFILIFTTAALATVQPAWQFDDSKASFPSHTNPIRLIVSDVDGTLVDIAGTFFEPNPAAFPVARLLGIQIALASGRSKQSVLSLIGEKTLAKMGYSGDPGIYLNGSYVVGPGGEVLRDIPLKESTVRRALDVLEEEGVLHRAKGVTKSGVVTYTAAKTYSPLDPIHKLHVEGDPETVARVRRRLEGEFGDEVEFVQSHGRSFQVVPPNCDKGAGLKLLLDVLNVKRESVLALGDAANDLPMFREAGVTVAVGDGYEVVKAAADFITVNSAEGALFEVLKTIMVRGLYPNAQLFRDQERDL